MAINKYGVKTLLPLMFLVLCLVLTGCAECISTEFKDVEVCVVDKYHRASWVQVIPCGKSVTTIVHPASWQITVEYAGVKYTVEGQDTYNKYKDRIGQTVIGKLQAKTYDDGSVKYSVVELKG